MFLKTLDDPDYEDGIIKDQTNHLHNNLMMNLRGCSTIYEVDPSVVNPLGTYGINPPGSTPPTSTGPTLSGSAPA